MTTDLVPVPIGSCPCPGTPHGDGDIVYLAPELSMAGGMAARQAIINGFTDQVEAQESLARIWLRHGIKDWTFTDEDGDPVPVGEAEAARLLPYGKGGRLVADKADDLYAQDVVNPLLIEAAKEAERLKRSRRGQMPKPSLVPMADSEASVPPPGSSTRSSRKKPRS